MDNHSADTPAFATRFPNLASAGLGARVLSVTDDFFAAAPRMLQDADAVFYPDRFDDNGKWMDGWESRRKRGEGHDHAVVALATATRIYGFDVDTSHFTGNYPPACSIEGCNLGDGEAPDADTQWSSIVAITPLGASRRHFIESDGSHVWTHLRLNIHPDGGVARFRVYGLAESKGAAGGADHDLASILNGARIVDFSDAHYGNYHRLLTPTTPENMGDGWETRRRREPGNDWIIIALAQAGIPEEAIVDTAFFKGNFPESCSIDAAYLPDALAAGPAADTMLVTASMFWKPLLERSALSADNAHRFDLGSDARPITHVRLNIHPDGGVSRFKLFGKPA